MRTGSRKAWMAFFIVTAVLIATPRVGLAIFAYRVRAVLRELEKVQVDRSSEADLQKIIPAMPPSAALPPGFHLCRETPHCYEIQLSSLPRANDVSPEYQMVYIRTYAERGEGALGLATEFTPVAPRERVHHVFEFHAECAWSFRGCKTFTQLFPELTADIDVIAQAALERMRANNPCSESMLPLRVRHYRLIHLLEVDSVQTEVLQDGHEYKVATYKFVRSFRGVGYYLPKKLRIPVNIGTVKIGLPRFGFRPRTPMHRCSCPVVAFFCLAKKAILVTSRHAC